MFRVTQKPKCPKNESDISITQLVTGIVAILASIVAFGLIYYIKDGCSMKTLIYVVKGILWTSGFGLLISGSVVLLSPVKKFKML
jgi:hypothetical protein